jgi:hypothetical protein
MQSLTWRRQRLATKFIIGVLCALIPIAGLLGLLWQQRREHELQAAPASVTQTANALAIIVDDALDDGEQLARTVATVSAVRTLDPAVFLDRLREVQAIHSGYSTLLVTDDRGTISAGRAGICWRGDVLRGYVVRRSVVARHDLAAARRHRHH